MSYPQPQLQFVADNIVRVHHPEILDPRTYLTASVAAAGTALTVASNAGFSNSDPQTLLLLGDLGSTTAEIKRVNGAITAGTALTSQAVTFAHEINTQVAKILFDQVEISGSTTLAGSKTVIDTVNITVNQRYTDFVVTGTTYAFYFARFKNSLSTTTYFGAYSDGIASTDFTPKTVGFIRRNALKNIGEEYGGRWDSKFIYDQIYLCELDVSKEKPTFSDQIELDYDLGNVSTGQRSVSLPSDIEDAQTYKSILGFRIGTRENMTFLDRATFEDVMQDVAVTTLSSTAAIGAVTLVLTDSNDFTDTGSVNIGGTLYTYTGNTRSTGTLTGLTALAAEITSGTNIWQGMTFGEPRRYSIKDGAIYFDTAPSSEFNGRNIWIDYFKGPSKPDSDTDTVLFNDPQLYISYIESAIKREKGNGELSLTDYSFTEYARRKNLLVTRDKPVNKVRLFPSVPGLHFSGRNPWWKR